MITERLFKVTVTYTDGFVRVLPAELGDLNWILGRAHLMIRRGTASRVTLTSIRG